MNLFKNIWQGLRSAQTSQVPEVLSEPQTKSSDPNTKLFTRVPEQFTTIETTERKFHFAIIELETLGPDPKVHPILEIGILKGCFTADGITGIIDSYWSLNDPLAPLPAEISQALGMTDQSIHEQFIDWQHVLQLISDCDVIICHNSRLKRSFLEMQTPDYIQHKCKELPFGCLLKDINWTSKSLDASNLKLLTYELGFFYEGKHLLTQCWASLNLLVQVTGAFGELKNTVKKRGIILCIIDNKLDRAQLLKLKKYAYTNGSKRFPKCWWAIIPEDSLQPEMDFLTTEVLSPQDITQSVVCYLIPSKMKHSARFKETAMHPYLEGTCWLLRETEPALAD